MANGAPASMIRVMREQNIASKSDAASSDATQETFYTDETTWDVGRNTTKVKAFYNVHSIDGSGKMDLIGQWSLDGVNWRDFSTEVFTGVTFKGMGSAEYSTTSDFGPKVRYGLRLKNDGGTSVQSAQVTLTLIARHYT